MFLFVFGSIISISGMIISFLSIINYDGNLITLSAGITGLLSNALIIYFCVGSRLALKDSVRVDKIKTKLKRHEDLLKAVAKKLNIKVIDEEEIKKEDTLKTDIKTPVIEAKSGETLSLTVDKSYKDFLIPVGTTGTVCANKNGVICMIFEVDNKFINIDCLPDELRR